jgi:hypothetical protein
MQVSQQIKWSFFEMAELWRKALSTSWCNRVESLPSLFSGLGGESSEAKESKPEEFFSY